MIVAIVAGFIVFGVEYCRAIVELKANKRQTFNNELNCGIVLFSIKRVNCVNCFKCGMLL